MTSPRTLLTAWNLKPNKDLGQNFLLNPAISSAIVNACRIAPEDTVLEIGSGLGFLTIPLAKDAGVVFAVEKDPHLVALLKTELALHQIGNVRLVEGDILRFDMETVFRESADPIIAVGNLPYNISSQILIKLMAHRSRVKHAVIMVQKEMALRVMEPPGSKLYGRISVMLQYCADIRKVMTVSAEQFFPRPNVESLVLMIRFKDPDHPAEDEQLLFKVIKAAFGKRRKTLKNALRDSELHVDSETAGAVLDAAGIDPMRRAETLSVEEFVNLSNVLGRRPNSGALR